MIIFEFSFLFNMIVVDIIYFDFNLRVYMMTNIILVLSK